MHETISRLRAALNAQDPVAANDAVHYLSGTTSG